VPQIAQWPRVASSDDACNARLPAVILNDALSKVAHAT